MSDTTKPEPAPHLEETSSRAGAPDNDASLCQPLVFVAGVGASWWASGVAEVGVVGLVVGSGSDSSEEPAVQDVEPVTLESESFLFCPPGPT